MSPLLEIIDKRGIKNSFFPENVTDKKMQKVLMVICKAKEDGLTTREVAEICDMSVYAARNWLMKLEESGHISRANRPRNTTWHVR